MPHLCATSPIPSIDQLLSQFAPSLTFPPVLRLPAIPGLPRFGLPSLPSPLFPDLNIPNLEMVTAALEMQASQMQMTMMGMIQPMLAFVGGALDSFLPKIPTLNLSLIDLLAGTPDRIIAAVKAAIANKLTIPFPSFVIPSPLFPTLTIPSIEAIQTMQMMVSNYMQGLTTKIVGLIGQVTGKLRIGLPTFPTMPTADQIWAKVMSLVPSLPNMPDFSHIVDLMRHGVGNLSAMLSSLTFPGLPSLPSLPNPLIPSFHLPDIEFNMGLIAMGNNLVLGMLQPIKAFIDNTLSRFLSFSFPALCIDF